MAEQLERRAFELIDSARNNDKFYILKLWDDGTLEINFGRNGTDGQTQIKRFATAGAARREMYRLVDEKTGKGYRVRADDGQLDTVKPPPAPTEPLPSKAELAEDFVRLLAQNRDK